jgi:23S rRNA (guanine745-N1)-methyltransferase
MKIIPADNLTCPLDGRPLHANGCVKQLICDAGHSFDIAKQGHVNLLAVQDKRSKDPGDSKDMVAARQRFLDHGVYQAVSDELNAIIAAHIQTLKNNKVYRVFDAGCGEGYYLDKLVASLKGVGRAGGAERSCALIGMDISKHAVLSAAKRNKRDISWVVGTNRKPPVGKASINSIICMFGYPVYSAFTDILDEGGIVILVESGLDHLIELREVAYDEVRKADLPSLDKALDAGFALESTQNIKTKTGALNAEQINDLLIMTPHFFKAKAENREQAAKLKSLDVTIDVTIRVLARR